MDIYLSSQVLQSGYNPQIRKNGPLLVDSVTNYDDFYTIVADNKDASKMKNITSYIYKYRADPKKQFSFEKKIDEKKYHYEGLYSLFDQLEVEEYEYESE